MTCDLIKSGWEVTWRFFFFKRVHTYAKKRASFCTEMQKGKCLGMKPNSKSAGPFTWFLKRCDCAWLRFRVRVSCYASQVKCRLLSFILSRSINPLKTFAISLSICDFRTNCLLKHRCGRQTKSPPLKTNLKQEIALLTALPRKQRKRPPLSGMTRWHEHKWWSRWLFGLIIG